MIEYEIVRSSRKTLAIQITKDCKVIVRAPYYVTKYQIEKIVKEKEMWIISKSAEIQKHFEKQKSIAFSDEEIAQFRKYVIDKVHEYADIMELNYGTIKFTNAKTRFGSCNTKTKNLCFSNILISKPRDAIDYVAVHELAHTIFPNHSKEFYQYIEKYMPDYRKRSKMLK